MEQAADAGQKFVDLFYEALDKRRHVSGVNVITAWNSLDCQIL